MPTIRERIKERNRARRIRLLTNLGLLFVLISIPTGLWQLIHRPDFSFGSIQISGTKQLTVEDVLELGEGQQPVNLFLLDRERVEEGLARDVRFEKATTSYAWPCLLQVQVVERKPALYLQNAHKNYVMLDYQGLVMNVTSGIPSDNAPMLVGRQCGDMYIGDLVEEKELQGLLHFLQQVGPATVDEFASIAVLPEGEVRIQLRDGLYIIFASLAEVPEKAEIFTQVYAEIKDKQLGAKYIDFTYKKPYVKLDDKLAPKLLQGVNR